MFQTWKMGKMHKTWRAWVEKLGNLFVKLHESEQRSTYCIINDCFYMAFVSDSLWLMAASPVHEKCVPFVSWHLIIIISLEAIIQKELPTVSWSCSIPYSSFNLSVSWEAQSSAPWEVSLIHPTWNDPVSSHTYQLLGRAVCITYSCWAHYVQNYIVCGPS